MKKTRSQIKQSTRKGLDKLVFLRITDDGNLENLSKNSRSDEIFKKIKLKTQENSQDDCTSNAENSHDLFCFDLLKFNLDDFQISNSDEFLDANIFDGQDDFMFNVFPTEFN